MMPVDVRLPEEQDPAKVILMIHKLLESGKSYAALLACERYLSGRDHRAELMRVIDEYEHQLENQHGESL